MEEKKGRLERHLPLLVALVGIVAGVVSANVTHYFKRKGELEKSHLELRQKAYLDFLQGQSLLLTQREKEGNELITSAKLNILLTGSRGVVCSMASYWAHANRFQTCPDFEARKRDAAIYQEMRRESFSSLEVPDPELDAAVIVPYLWDCLLPRTDPNRLCK